MKKIIASLLLACSFGAWAQEVYPPQQDIREQARDAQLADVATTAVGLAMGASEANPLGLLLLPLKYVVFQEFDAMPPGPERDEAFLHMKAWGYGPAVNNLCVILVIATGGTGFAACPLLGLGTVAYIYNTAE
jgi:hypothetical protein